MNNQTFIIQKSSADNCMDEIKKRFAHLKKYDQQEMENGQDQCIRHLQTLIDKHIATHS